MKKMKKESMQNIVAELYWDTQDPNNTGWWLRYRDRHGAEEGEAIDGAENASIKDLAEALADAPPIDAGTIRVYRGAEVCGEIVIAAGAVVRDV